MNGKSTESCFNDSVMTVMTGMMLVYQPSCRISIFHSSKPIMEIKMQVLCHAKVVIKFFERETQINSRH